MLLVLYHTQGAVLSGINKQDRLRLARKAMKRRPLYVRRKCNQNIMGKDVGFCMVSKRQVATYG